jgi:hypothetical protein
MPDYSLTSVRASLEPVQESRPTSIKQLAHFIRWEDGWQGKGPISCRSLVRTIGGDTLRKTLSLINPGNSTESIKAAYIHLHYPMGGGVSTLPQKPISVREISRRIQTSETQLLRFLSYNTYLLQGLQIPLSKWIDDAIGWDALAWFGIPFGSALLALLGITSPATIGIAELLKIAGFTPSKVVKKVTGLDLGGITIKEKPALESRSAELGEILSDYDLCCLCEVWTQDSINRIADSLDMRHWRKSEGLDGSGAWTLNGSGLLFLAKNRNIVKTEQLVYSNLGDRLRDADAWTKKGAMLNVIDLGFGQLESRLSQNPAKPNG